MKDNTKLLNKSGLEWISVKDGGYPDEYFENPYECCYLVFMDDGWEIGFRNWKGSYFEGEHIKDEPKVAYWTVFKIPNGQIY